MTQLERNKLTQNYLNSIGYQNKVAVFTTTSAENKIVFAANSSVSYKLEVFLKELGYQIEIKK